MIPRPLLGTILLLEACAGAAADTTLTANPSAPPADAIGCVRSKLNDLGYQTVAFDAADHRIVARKLNEKIDRPDPQFRRAYDRLEIQADAGASGKTDLKVAAHTTTVYNTQRGPTENEEQASGQAKEAAQAVIQACGQP